MKLSWKQERSDLWTAKAGPARQYRIAYWGSGEWTLVLAADGEYHYVGTFSGPRQAIAAAARHASPSRIAVRPKKRAAACPHCRRR